MNSTLTRRSRIGLATAALAAAALITTACSGGGSLSDQISQAGQTAPAASAAGGPAWAEMQGATAWFTTPRSTVDNSHITEETLNCSDYKTNGTALYPYIATDSEFSDNYTYRNMSSSGVTVKSDTVSHDGSINGYLYATVAAPTGNHKFQVSFECTTNNTTNGTFIISANTPEVTSNSATVNMSYYNQIGSDTNMVYEVQYGPAAGDYPQNTGLLKATMVSTGPGNINIPLTGLQPSTTYHYRVLQNAAGSSQLDDPNYTADQTFTTPAA